MLWSRTEATPFIILDRNRFHNFEDGHEQHITYFDESKPAPAEAVATQLSCLKQTSPRVVSNVSCAPATGAVNVFLLDPLNTKRDQEL
jgi:hypothetical protein